MSKHKWSLIPDLSLTQKIFFSFIVLLFLIVNSWAFTFSTVLDVRDGFTQVQTYAFPSVITTSRLKDEVHIALLNVYNYVSTGDEESKTQYQNMFNSAIRSEYELFQLSQTPNDFTFTQQFNDKLLAVYNAADNLVTIYERNPDSPEVADQLRALNGLRDDFNAFLNTEITEQITEQIASANSAIGNTVKQIQWYVIAVTVLVLVTLIYITVFISRSVRKPLAQLTEAAERFGKGNFQKVDIQSNDELGVFAKTFNTMAADIQANQEALRAELAKTKELDRQKSEFLSIAAHQLRTPMAGIKWATQMIHDGDMGDISEEQKHHLDRGLENINRMIKLINDLLDVTKIEEQTFNYEFEIADMRDIVATVVNNLATTIEERKVKVLTHISPDQPTPIEVDVEKISLAINNLVDNAIKYSNPEGIIDVHVTSDHQSVTIAVHDEGIGIPAKSQSEVFTKFFRAANAMKMFADGSGLGLFIVKDVVTKHHGSITFNSESGKGTTFTFTIPKEQPEEIENASVEAAIEKASK